MKAFIIFIVSTIIFVVQLFAQTKVDSAIGTGAKVASVKNKLDRTINGVVLNDNNSSSNVASVDETNGKTKIVVKSFIISKTDKVTISNVYGSITVKTWNKDEARLDAFINAESSRDNNTQKLIDKVDILASKVDDGVSFQTKIEPNDSRFGLFGGSEKREVQVAITLYIPTTVTLTATQQYGNITLDDFDGPTSLKVQYGDLTVNSLNNTKNSVSAQYSKVNIQNVKSAKLSVQYGGGLKIGTVDELDLLAQYAGVTIGWVKRGASIKQQYGNGLKIGKINDLTLTAQYANVNLEKLYGNLSAKIQYGKFKVSELETPAGDIKVDSQYAQVGIGFGSNLNADFSVKCAYSNVTFGDRIAAKKLSDDRREGHRKEYSGTIGKGGSTVLKITAQYGGVTFN